MRYKLSRNRMQNIFYYIKTYFLNLKAKHRGYKIKIIDPEKLYLKYNRGPYDNVSSKYYSKFKHTYYKNELVPYINGKKVRFWRLVKINGVSSDEYIPVFYK